MTPHEKDTLAKALPPDQAAVITVAIAADSGAVDGRMKNFCEQLKAIAPQVRTRADDDTGFPSPALITGMHGNTAYQAIPQGKILDCFIDALRQTSKAVTTMGAGLDAQLTRLVLPADIKVYFAAQCPHCPATIRQLQTLAGASAKIRLTIIDASLFPQPAQRDNVRAVPTVILDEQFRWSGQIDLAEVLSMCVERDPAQLSPVSLKQLIEEGAAETVAQMMIDAGRHFPALIELLAHERWSVRLGAMVTVEYLADAAQELAAGLAAALWQRISDASPQAQGDMTHTLGQIQAPAVRQYLQHIVDGDYSPAAVEAATEALDEINEA